MSTYITRQVVKQLTLIYFYSLDPFLECIELYKETYICFLLSNGNKIPLRLVRRMHEVTWFNCQDTTLHFCCGPFNLNSTGKYVCKRASWVSGLRKSLILLLAWYWPDFALSGWERPWKCCSQMEPLKWVTRSAYRHSLLLLKDLRKTFLILLF